MPENQEENQKSKDADADKREGDNDQSDDSKDKASDKDGKDDKNDKGGKEGKDGKEEKKPMDPAKKRRLTIIAIIVGIIVLILAIIFFTRYWLDGRFLEETDDAYLKADAVIIAPKVSGYVTKVLVTDNQIVKAGQALVTLDGRQYRAALDTAHATIDSRKADIVKAEAQDAQFEAALAQARAQRATAVVNENHATEEVNRYAPLAASGADSPEHLATLVTTQKQARASLQEADAGVRSAQQQIAGGKAQLQQAQSQLEAAQATATQSLIDAQDTTIVSAIDGRVGDKTVQVGQLAQPGTRFMSIVPTEAIYLIANFKETQVGRMRPGQPATISVDALSGVKLRGHIESFSPGTGSQFALLQPENATGNFTKIVQRVPVRIAVEAGERTRQLLVPGLSVKVEVDTHSGKDDLKDIKQDEEARSKQEKRADKQMEKQGLDAPLNSGGNPNGR
jgi:membrane fusion protein (multidrug efflux system)